MTSTTAISMKINKQAQNFDKPITKAIENAYHNFCLAFLSSHAKKENFPQTVYFKKAPVAGNIPFLYVTNASQSFKSSHRMEAKCPTW